MDTPHALLQVNLARMNPTWPMYAVSSDGRFLMIEPVESEENPPVIHVVENWYEAYRDREQD